MPVDTASEYKQLWLTVLLRTQEEAEGKYGATLNERKRAQKWLTKCSKSFMLVCNYAGLDKQSTLRLSEDSRKKYGNR